MYVYHIVIYDVLTCNLNVSLNIIYASTVQRINTSIDLSICQYVNPGKRTGARREWDRHGNRAGETGEKRRKGEGYYGLKLVS